MQGRCQTLLSIVTLTPSHPVPSQVPSIQVTSVSQLTVTTTVSLLSAVSSYVTKTLQTATKRFPPKDVSCEEMSSWFLASAGVDGSLKTFLVVLRFRHTARRLNRDQY
ncbi:hypothetical protein ACROYT_G042359 [Oculina patagonica]